MGARTRLNQIYLLTCLAAAALLGGLSGSWGVFLLALAAGVAGCLYSGDIRPGTGRGGKGPR